ncbi:MAG: hypothetical protein CMF74_11760 [Maricaulis sp.]|jgi:hypothetical protein|nr:hypothetical protein [Maricaulis sp.]|tara:strand:- start:160 stop:693 length:534 start_codon:yes stop_codon:yes gene_type:complete
MDLEAESAVSVDTGKLKDISTSCKKLLETQKEIDKMEDALKELKEEERIISEETIPNLMQEAGVSMIKTEDGKTVQVSQFYAARIPQSKQGEAFDWLRENGAGDMIKNIVSCNFGRAEDGQATDLVADLQSKGLNVSQKMKVEPMTLKSYVKTEIEKGRSVPMDLFGVYVANKTTIK